MKPHNTLPSAHQHPLPLPPSPAPRPRDGETHNLSWNCGEEGPSAKAEVVSLRQRQMRNFMGALLLGHGVPMFYMGDEYGHRWGEGRGVG